MKLSPPSLKRPARRGRRVVGLEIEPGAVRAVQARIEGGRLKVEHAVSAPLDASIVRDGEVVQPDELAVVLRDLFAEHKLDKKVRIGVANQRIVVREMLVPPIDDAKQLATAVHFLASDELPMPVDQAVLDYIVLGPVETTEGKRLRVLLVAARRTMIDTLLAAARTAGLKPEGIDLAAFAMVRALGSHPGAVLHLGVGGVVNLVVMRDGDCVFTRVIAGGIESMATDLAERRMIEIEEARAVLHAARIDGSASPLEGEIAGDARTVIEMGLRRIAGEVRNSLDFLASGEAGAAPAGTEGTDPSPAVERVVLSGPAIAIPGFAEALSERLGLPVDVADVDGVDDHDRGRYAVAAGLTVEEVPA
jgi:type IV pilus assembly protein PilM